MASPKTILAISAITTIASSTTVKAIISTKEHAITVITTMASPTNVHAITAITTIASPTSVKATAVVATIESSSGGSRGLVVIRDGLSSEVVGFESQYQLLNGHFFTLIKVVVFVCLKN